MCVRAREGGNPHPHPHPHHIHTHAHPAADLLSKPYPDTHKVELKTVAANGVTFVTEAVVGAIPAAAPKKRATAVLTAKAEGVVSGKFKVDKVAVDTNKDVTGEFSLADVVAGTKLTFKATDGTRAAAVEGVPAVTATLGAEHRNDHGTFTADVEVIKQTVDVSGVVAFDAFLLGGSVSVSRGKGAVALEDYAALVGYKAKDLAVSLAGEKKLSAFVASYHQVVNPTLTVAAQAKVPRAPADADKFELTAGAQYKSSADVTLAAKATHKGKVAFSYAQQLSALAKVTIGTEIDTAKITSDSAHKLAVSVNFTA